MTTRTPRAAFGPHDMPLDAARAAFDWLVTGPAPLAVDGRTLPGLPDRDVPLDEVRHHLLHRHCPQPVRDAVWAHLVEQSRQHAQPPGGGSWTVGCVGVALPALTGITARLTSRFVGDPRDIHAAVLIGFLAELATIDTTRPRIMLRLRWAAYRAGLACLREALDAPIPSTSTFHTTPTTGPGSLAPAGHPDLVLAAAVAAGVITTAEAELIGSTRLEDMPLAQAAARRGSSYEATRKARQRAEHRLAAHLHILDTDTDTDTDLPYDASAAAPAEPSRTVAVMRMSATRRRRVRRRVSPNPGSGGVQVRVPDRPGPVRAEPLVHPAAPPTARPGPTPEVPRCA